MTAPSAAELRRQTLVAIFLTCVAYALFNVGDALLKLIAARDLHFSQIIIINCTIINICTASAGWLREGKKAFVVLNPKLIMCRSFFSAVTGVCNILALPHIKLTTFYTLVFTSPFWVALLAAIFLKEKLALNRVLVILAGFATVAFVFRPGTDDFNIWAILILVGAFFYSCGLIVMRKVGPKESRTMIILMGSIVSILVALPFFPYHYKPLEPVEWLLFFGMGSLSAISVTCIAYAFQTAPAASVVAPFHYTQIIWGALLGYVLFNEIPDDRIILGAAVIIAAGLYLIFSETRGKKKSAKKQQPELPETAAPP